MGKNHHEGYKGHEKGDSSHGGTQRHGGGVRNTEVQVKWLLQGENEAEHEDYGIII